jgi:hypothetical protein
MHQRHVPELYIAGIYIHQTQVWCGEFAASVEELFDYAEHDVRTVEEYTVVLDMVQAQQVYAMWWDQVKNK